MCSGRVAHSADAGSGATTKNRLRSTLSASFFPLCAQCASLSQIYNLHNSTPGIQHGVGALWNVLPVHSPEYSTRPQVETPQRHKGTPFIIGGLDVADSFLQVVV